MSTTTSGELHSLLMKSLDDYQAHDTLVSLWQGNEELLVELEESLSNTDGNVAWLDREHQELRGALIRLMCVDVSFSHIQSQPCIDIVTK